MQLYVGIVLGIALIASLVYAEVPRTTANATENTVVASLLETVEILADDPGACHENGIRTVGIQAGHWQADELPDELATLRESTGASAGGYNEWEVMLDLAVQTKQVLEAQGITVDLIPATVPESYCADLFISLHADGNDDTSVRGYKAVAKRGSDASVTAFVTSLEAAYGEATGMPQDFAISKNMTSYYAFSAYRFQHSVHRDTPAIILETGFLTNYYDRVYLLNHTETIADILATTISQFVTNRTY